MAKILIISAGWEQEPLVKTAKDLGHMVVATHGTKDAEGFKYADKTYIVDPKDVLRLYDIAVSEKIDGVIADQCDYSYYATAYISERLDLPGAKLQTAQWVTNKGRSRIKLMEDNYIFQPKFKICEGYEDTLEAGELIGFPLVVKPTDNRGSIGVSKVEDAYHLKDAYLLAVAQAHSRTVLIEEFVEGIEVALDGYCLKEKEHQILSIASKKHSENGLFDDEIITPAEISGDMRDELEKVTSKVLKQLGIDFGATHIEYMVTPQKKCYLMEAHNRGGGIFISNKVNPIVSGIDTNKCLIFDCLGQPYENINLNQTKTHTLIKFITLPPGKIKSAELKNKNGLEDILVAFKIYAPMGSLLPPIVDCATRHGFITLCAGNKEDLYQNFDKVYKHIQLKYD